MRKNLWVKFIIFGVLIILIGGMINTLGLNKFNSILIHGSEEKEFYSSTSTNPINPEILLNNISKQEYYIESNSYYYKTDIMLYLRYQIVWVRPNSTEDDFDLFLYSDSGYSNLKTSSNRANGLLEWVVFRNSYSYYLYPKVYAYSGSGYASIEWQDASSILSIDNSVNNSLNSTNSIEAYQAFLTAGVKYNFSCQVPGGADYDLYIYYLTSGSAINFGGYAKSSALDGNGVDEYIQNFIPISTGEHAILVVRKDGTGIFTLNFSTSCIIPTILSDDSEILHYYNASNSYYYQTGLASSSYYQVVWLQPNSTNNFDLELYNSINYTASPLTSSMRENDSLEWVVFRSSTSQYFYLKANAIMGEGYAYIEWEDSSTSISSGSSYQFSQQYSDSIEIYQISLDISSIYSFYLKCPANCDFNLYLYQLSSGGVTNSSGYIRASATLGNGIHEEIDNFKPTVSGSYAIIVVQSNGTGTYTLTYTSPSTLYDDSVRNDYYYNSFSYFYRTSYAYSSYYHMISLYPTSQEDDFNLYLYNDSSYTNLIGSSCKGAGALDWVIFRTSSSQNYYPKVHACLGDGSAYIKWEDSSDSLWMPGSISTSIGSSENFVIYQIYLESSEKYDFTLDFYSNSDLDLYIYYLDPAAVSNSSGYIQCSATVGYGTNEEIKNFQPLNSGYYAVIIVRMNGSGSFTMGTYYSPPSSNPIVFDPLIMIVIIFSICLVIPMVIVIYQKFQQQQRERERQRQQPRPAQQRVSEARNLERNDIAHELRLNRMERRAHLQNQQADDEEVLEEEYIEPEEESEEFSTDEPVYNLNQFKYCPRCRFKNRINQLFCENCGAELQ